MISKTTQIIHRKRMFSKFQNGNSFYAVHEWVGLGQGRPEIQKKNKKRVPPPPFFRPAKAEQLRVQFFRKRSWTPKTEKFSFHF